MYVYICILYTIYIYTMNVYLCILYTIYIRCMCLYVYYILFLYIYIYISTIYTIRMYIHTICTLYIEYPSSCGNKNLTSSSPPFSTSPSKTQAAAATRDVPTIEGFHQVEGHRLGERIRKLCQYGLCVNIGTYIYIQHIHRNFVYIYILIY